MAPQPFWRENSKQHTLPSTPKDFFTFAHFGTPYWARGYCDHTSSLHLVLEMMCQFWVHWSHFLEAIVYCRFWREESDALIMQRWCTDLHLRFNGGRINGEKNVTTDDRVNIEQTVKMSHGLAYWRQYCPIGSHLKFFTKRTRKNAKNGNFGHFGKLIEILLVQHIPRVPPYESWRPDG